MSNIYLKQFAYISHQVHDFSDGDLRELMKQARKKNSELGLTGLLLFDKPIFFQVLEGPSESIDRMCATLEIDERHKDMEVIYTNNDLREREFARWSMGCKILGGGLPSDYKDLDERVKNIFHVSASKGKLAHQLLLDFRDMKNSFVDI